MPVRRLINTPNAPQSKVPLSQAVQVDNTLYVSGNLGMDPKNGNKLVPGGIKAETEQALRNIEAILTAAGTDMSKVVKVQVLMQDVSIFPEVNEVYAKFFPQNPPARMAYQVAALPVKGALIEIECIAIVGDLLTSNL